MGRAGGSPRTLVVWVTLIAPLLLCAYGWVALWSNGAVDSIAALLMGHEAAAVAWGGGGGGMRSATAAVKFSPPAHCLQSDDPTVAVLVPPGAASSAQLRAKSVMRRTCATNLLQPDVCAAALEVLRTKVDAARKAAVEERGEAAHVPSVELSFRAVHSTVQSIKVDGKDEALTLNPSTDVAQLVAAFCREKNLYAAACGALRTALQNKYDATFCRLPSPADEPVPVQGSW